VNWDPGEYDGHLPDVLSWFDMFKDSHPSARGGQDLHRALDVGCGNGKSVVWLAEHGFEATGIDLSPAAIEQANARARTRGVEAAFVCGRFPDDFAVPGPFDFICERAFLQHLGKGRELHRALERIAELLRTGGIFYSLIIAGGCLPRYWGMSRWTESDVRETIGLYFTIRDLREEVFTPGEPGSVPAWLTVATNA